jgi:hypothetical protein
MRQQRSSPDNFYCALSQRPSRYPVYAAGLRNNCTNSISTRGHTVWVNSDVAFGGFTTALPPNYQAQANPGLPGLGLLRGREVVPGRFLNPTWLLPWAASAAAGR